MTCQCNHGQREYDGELDQELANIFGESELGYETYFGDQEFDPELDQELDPEYDPESELDMETESEIHGKDTRVLVPNTKEAPFRYICNIELNGRGNCTGTLIGPRTVLTAGHCIYGVDEKDLRVIPGRAGSKEPFGSSRVAVGGIKTPAGYKAVSPTDYGILILKDKIGDKVGYWTRGYKKNKGDTVGTSILPGSLPIPLGKQVNLAGYPADRPFTKKMFCRDPKGGDPYYCKATSGPKRSKYCGTYQYKSYEALVKKIKGILHYEHDTCPAQSGSPVWVRRHPSMGGRVLVGLHVEADDPNVPGKLNQGIIIDDAMRKFIIKHTQ